MAGGQSWFVRCTRTATKQSRSPTPNLNLRGIWGRSFQTRPRIIDKCVHTKSVRPTPSYTPSHRAWVGLRWLAQGHSGRAHVQSGRIDCCGCSVAPFLTLRPEHTARRSGLKPRLHVLPRLTVLVSWHDATACGYTQNQSYQSGFMVRFLWRGQICQQEHANIRWHVVAAAFKLSLKLHHVL